MEYNEGNSSNLTPEEQQRYAAMQQAYTEEQAEQAARRREERIGQRAQQLKHALGPELGRMVVDHAYRSICRPGGASFRGTKKEVVSSPYRLTGTYDKKAKTATLQVEPNGDPNGNPVPLWSDDVGDVTSATFFASSRKPFSVTASIVITEPSLEHPLKGEVELNAASVSDPENTEARLAVTCLSQMIARWHRSDTIDYESIA
jgi:hypothetical protein